jgi:NADPH2 dehydrogenase
MEDLGIWSDDQINGLRDLTELIHEHGSKIGIQLAHAGRKSKVDGAIIAPSSIPFTDISKTPVEMTKHQVKETILSFQSAAKRAKLAGFDVVEIHAAHGYLIHEFLSPLSNKRNDEYGGTKENRYRFLSEIISKVKEVWEGPLFVRISANDYSDNGNQIEDYVVYGKWMKQQGVDLIDCSSGEVIPTFYDVYPGYQIKYSENIKFNANIATGAVGLITEAVQAEEIIHNGRADLVFIGRELLRNPYWPLTAAKQLGVSIDFPKQYKRGWE